MMKPGLRIRQALNQTDDLLDASIQLVADRLHWVLCSECALKKSHWLAGSAFSQRG